MGCQLAYKKKEKEEMSKVKGGYLSGVNFLALFVDIALKIHGRSVL